MPIRKRRSQPAVWALTRRPLPLALLTCLSMLALLFAAPWIAAHARAIPTYKIKVTGNDTVMAPEPHCSHPKDGDWRAQICLTTVAVGHWTPEPLPPFLGGMEELDVHAVATYIVTHKGIRTPPWRVKMLLDNVAEGRRDDPEHICGWLNRCEKAVHALKSSWEGFSWHYVLPPFEGCANVTDTARLQVSMWPTHAAPRTWLFGFRGVELHIEVCSPSFL